MLLYRQTCEHREVRARVDPNRTMTVMSLFFRWSVPTILHLLTHLGGCLLQHSGSREQNREYFRHSVVFTTNQLEAFVPLAICVTAVTRENAAKRYSFEEGVPVSQVPGGKAKGRI